MSELPSSRLEKVIYYLPAALIMLGIIGLLASPGNINLLPYATLSIVSGMLAETVFFPK